MQFAALGHLHRHLLAQNLAHALRKGLARIAAIGQNALSPAQGAFAALERLQGAFAIGDVCRSDSDGVWQPLRIYGNVALFPFPEATPYRLVVSTGLPTEMSIMLQNHNYLRAITSS